MKKYIFLTLFFGVFQFCFSQKMMTRSGEIKFEASMPAFEEIAATNNTASCILDKATGDFVALALIKSFKFKSPLMEEHFNENYLESTQFPKATFKGKILNFDATKITSKTTFELEGELTLHGVSKKIKTKITLSMIANKINVVSSFFVKPQDFKIEIPSLVKSKIAEKIEIAVNFNLEPKQ